MTTPPIEVSNAVIAIQLATDYIRNNDSDSLELILAKMPLEQLSASESITLLNRFLSICAEFTRDECTIITMKAWDRAFPPDIQIIPLLAQLFLEPIFNEPTLKYLVS